MSRGRYKAYSEEQAMQMVKDYQTGLSLREVGDIYFCSWSTVQNYLKRQEEQIRPKSIPKYPAGKIMKDWNGGVDAAKIKRKYGFPSVGALYGFVKRWRNKGFVKRTGWTRL